MDDLISRKAVLKAINNMVKECDSVYVTSALRNLEVIVADVPHAQPETHEERTETHACDCISRQAAIDAHYEYCNKHPDAGFPVWSLKILEDLPSAQQDLSGYSDRLWKAAYERGKAEAQAQLEEAYISGETEAEARFHAQQRWIPCSERLPDEEVLCCDTRGEMIIGYPYPDEESNTGFSAESDEVFMDCAAWMPLPKSCRAERKTDGN